MLSKYFEKEKAMIKINKKWIALGFFCLGGLFLFLFGLKKSNKYRKIDDIYYRHCADDWKDII